MHHSPPFCIHSTYISGSPPFTSIITSVDKHNTDMAQPPPYNEVLKEREEFERDVSAAGVGIPCKPFFSSKHTMLTC